MATKGIPGVKKIVRAASIYSTWPSEFQFLDSTGFILHFKEKREKEVIEK